MEFDTAWEQNQTSTSLQMKCYEVCVCIKTCLWQCAFYLEREVTGWSCYVICYKRCFSVLWIWVIIGWHPGCSVYSAHCNRSGWRLSVCSKMWRFHFHVSLNAPFPKVSKTCDEMCWVLWQQTACSLCDVFLLQIKSCLRTKTQHEFILTFY